jgi:phage baseplate assembly protein W
MAATDSLTISQLNIIGKGMKFPNPVRPERGSTEVNQGYERINQSILNILSTPIGTRIGNRLFGSKMNTLVFEQNDFILADLIKLYAFEALSTWEPRISVSDIDVVPDPDDDNIVNVTIHYVLKNSNLVNNFVYPFTKQQL